MSTTQQTKATAAKATETPAEAAKAIVTATDQRRARAAAKTGAKPAPKPAAKPRPAAQEPTQLAKDVKAAVDAAAVSTAEAEGLRVDPATGEIIDTPAPEKPAEKPAEAKPVEKAPEPQAEEPEKPAEKPKESSVERFARLAQEKKAREAAAKAEKAAPKPKAEKAEAKPKEAKAKAEPVALVMPVLPEGKRPKEGAVARQQPIDGKDLATGYARGWHVHTNWILEEEFMGATVLNLSFDRRFGDCQFWFTNPETGVHEHMHTEYGVASDIEAIRQFGCTAEPFFTIRTKAKQ